MQSCMRCNEPMESTRYEGRLPNHSSLVKKLEDIVERLKKGEVYLTHYDVDGEDKVIDVDIEVQLAK